MHKLRNNISVLEGSGGNIAVLTGPDGKVLVDAGIGVSRPQLTKALADLGAEPVTHLINTHWHFDHTDGNTWLNSVGAKIIAQENTRRFSARSAARRGLGLQFCFPATGRNADARCSRARLISSLNGQSIKLKHYSARPYRQRHFRERSPKRTSCMSADTFWNGVYPFIDYSTGGSIDGMIAACDANLAAATAERSSSPGHGQPVSNKAELQAVPRHAGQRSGEGRSAQAAGPIAR